MSRVNTPITTYIQKALEDIAWFLGKGGNIHKLGNNITSHRLISEAEMGAAGTLILVPRDEEVDCMQGLNERDIRSTDVQIAFVMGDGYQLFRDCHLDFDENPLDEREVFFRLYNDFQAVIDRFRLSLPPNPAPVPSPSPPPPTPPDSAPVPAPGPAPATNEWDLWILRGG